MVQYSVLSTVLEDRLRLLYSCCTFISVASMPNAKLTYFSLLKSLRLQEFYAASIKENNCLNPLLEFMFDFLQYPNGILIDASKLTVDLFELDQSDSFEKEAQWLLVHLYYLCLKYLPGLTKSWWITKNRTKGPVEAWTQKYVSSWITFHI